MKFFMRKIAFLLAIFMVSDVSIFAYTNKTYLRVRPENANLPLMLSTFDELILHKDTRSFKGNVQVVGFYNESTKSDKMGRYFLPKEKNNILFQALQADAGYETTKGTLDDIDALYFSHGYGIDATTAATLINAPHIMGNLRPYQINYGLHIDYNQSLDKICTNLFCYVSIPVVHLEQDIRYKIFANQPDPADIRSTLEKFFLGQLEVLSVNDPAGIPNGNGQVRLTNAKFASKQIATGIADIDAGLGYTIFDQEAYHLAAAVALTFPTSNKARGEYLFEPIYGNGHHLGIGADFDAWLKLWGNKVHNIKVKIAGQVRYLMEGTEKRTLGIKGRQWGQYFLLGKVGQDQLIPAANVLTRDVSVTPGTMFDGIVALAYNNKGFALDLGYNMFAHERTAVHINSFPNYTYAIAGRGVPTNELEVVRAGANIWIDPRDAQPGDVATGNIRPMAFTLQARNVDGGNVDQATINIDTIDTSVAETPSQFTNSIYGSLGYIFDSPHTPAMLSIGGKYEWADKNSALEQWGVWAKLGFGF